MKKERRLQGPGHKFKPRYDGVYRINQLTLTDAWIVPYGKPEERELKVHLNYLRKFEGTYVPAGDLKVRLKIKGRTEPNEEDPMGEVEAELAEVELHNQVMGEEEKPTGSEFVYDEDGRWAEWLEVNEVWCDEFGKKYRWEDVGLIVEPMEDAYICPKCRGVPFIDDVLEVNVAGRKYVPDKTGSGLTEVVKNRYQEAQGP